MSATTASIIARLGMDSGEYRKDLATVVKENKRAQSQMAVDAEKAAKRATEAQKKAHADQIASIKSAAGAMAGAMGMTFGLSGAISAGQAILTFAGNLQDASDAMGIGVEQLQELQGAFSQSGASTETVNKGLAKLSENLTAAREGDEKLVDSFGKLGVTWEDINKLAPDEVLMKIAASAGEAYDPAERLSLIIDTLGKSGRQMAAGLNQGREALQKTREEIQKLSKEDIALLDEAGDMLGRIKDKAMVTGAQTVLGIAKTAAGIGSNIGGGKKMPPGFLPAAVAPIAPAAQKVEPKPEATRMSPREAREKAALEKQQSAEFTALKKTAEEEKKLDAECYEAARDHLKKTIDDAKNLREKADKERLQREEKDREDAHKAELARIKNEASARAKAQADRKNDKLIDINDPQGKADRRRAASAEKRASKRAEREMALEDRGGKSAADVAQENGGMQGPSEPILQREARLRRIRGEQAKKGMAKGREGATGQGGEFKSALSTVEQHLKNIDTKLRGPKAA